MARSKVSWSDLHLAQSKMLGSAWDLDLKILDPVHAYMLLCMFVPNKLGEWVTLWVINWLSDWLSTQCFSTGKLSDRGYKRNEIWHQARVVMYCHLTLSPLISLRLYTLPYWSNWPFLISDILALSPERQNVRN